jgi:hypothetical protein
MNIIDNCQYLITEHSPPPLATALTKGVVDAETGSMESLEIGLVSVEVDVLRVTTLVSPSEPGCRASTRARGHLVGGKRSSESSTMEPTLMSFEG